MTPQNDRPTLPPLELQPAMLPAAPVAAQESVASTLEDRLYQFAALTAGAFLLVTLL